MSDPTWTTPSGRPGRPLVVVRHASAGSRKRWVGDDDERPLDKRGRAQAEALVPVLARYQIRRAYSAPVVRCLETIEPFVRASGVHVEHEPLLAEAVAAEAVDRAVDWLLGVAGKPEPSLLCTQRGALSAVLPEVLRRLGDSQHEAPRLRKGAVLVIHLDESGEHLISMERLPEPL